MMAPTHAAFGAVAAAIPEAGMTAIIASSIGALLPDIDHPQSAIGRIFFFISYPLNGLIGHRTWTHAFLPWALLSVFGVVLGSDIVLWLGIGAITHILADSFTISGTQAFLPFTDRTVVCFRRDWRIYTGSVKEILICVVLIAMIGAMQKAHAIGGPRKMINYLVSSPKITVEEYRRAGETISRAQGQFRWADGRIEEVDWLVVGTEGTHLVYWNEEEIIKKRHGEFLRSKLIESRRQWPSVRIDGVATAKRPSFFYGGKKWLLAWKGDPVYGTVKTVTGDVPEIAFRSGIDTDILGNANRKKGKEFG